ncbi:VOC family protein [Pseudomonas jessenii]|uniref:VOC family protein n=1 Tax=Pseudomonas jessenii TaxID=77298 RepID=UPI003D80EC62
MFNLCYAILLRLEAPIVKLNPAQPARHVAPTVCARALTHLIIERPDLERTERFLQDFGLLTVLRNADLLLLRGTGPTPYCYRVHRGKKPRFIGFGLSVGSCTDLERLSLLPQASPIMPCDHPGGGEQVTLRDPSGFLVEALHGQSMVGSRPHRSPLPLNLGNSVVRINATQRPPIAPPEIIRLGHLVLEVADFQRTCAWYTQHFGFIPSDVQLLPDGSPAVAFLRLNLGDTPADHHTLALAQGFMPAYGHSAYEVVDLDAVGMGQKVLRDQGWRHAWGIGRHILGSQIFDYWQDPFGDKHEHYCDGDRFTADQPTGLHSVSAAAMSQWGESMPRSFTKPKLTPANVLSLFRHLRRSPDLSVRKLITLARLFT